MTEKDLIRRLLKEADLYRTQGLLSDAKSKYGQILSVIGKSKTLADNKDLIVGVKTKIRAVDKSLNELRDTPEKPELSGDLQNLIKKLFTFSQTKEAAAIEGAVALAKFGQYEQALKEFHKLLEQGVLPVVTAKNMIKCYTALKSPKAAVAQFAKWKTRDFFSTEDLKYIRTFLKTSLEKEGFKTEIPEVETKPALPSKAKKKKEETFLEISAISIHLQGGPLEGQTMDFDVHFQSANTVTVLIPSVQKNLADTLIPGTRLSDIQCYSPITVFKSTGTVSGTAKIKQGPRQGDYTLDITIDAD
jgi:tetratricopeptide (TPR) repeat protein